MNVDGVERIAFRFARREVAALLKLMGASGLPETSIAAEEPEDATVQSLVESGIVMLCGDRAFVDRTVSLVLQTAARAERLLCAKSPLGQRLLYAGEKMCVLLEDSGGPLVTLEPLQNPRAAKEPFLESARALGGEMELLLRGDGALISRTGDAKALEALYAQFEGQ